MSSMLKSLSALDNSKVSCVVENISSQSLLSRSKNSDLGLKAWHQLYSLPKRFTHRGMSCEDPGIPQRYRPFVPKHRLRIERFRSNLEQCLHQFSSKLKVPGASDVDGELHVVLDTEGHRHEPPLVLLHLDSHSVIEESSRDTEVIRNINITQDCPRSNANLTLHKT